MKRKRLKWKCPKCGATAGKHGKGRCHDKPEGGAETICQGLVCECDDDGEDMSHGHYSDNPCQNAVCYHCGWSGRFPRLKKGEVELTEADFNDTTPVGNFETMASLVRNVVVDMINEGVVKGAVSEVPPVDTLTGKDDPLFGLIMEVEGLINSRDQIPSSRVLAETIVNLVVDTVNSGNSAEPKPAPKPWGTQFAVKLPFKETKGEIEISPGTPLVGPLPEDCDE